MKKNKAAVALSKLGASKGGNARALKLSSQKRKGIAKKAAEARWNGKKKKNHKEDSVVTRWKNRKKKKGGKANKLEALRPLLEPAPRGEVFVGGFHPPFRVICLSCGATDGVMMIRKHDKDCDYIAYYKARELLRAMLWSHIKVERSMIKRK